jgi:hypothetical protein
VINMQCILLASTLAYFVTVVNYECKSLMTLTIALYIKML